MAEEEKDVEYGLVLPFDSDDPEFTRGFEAGMLYMSLGDKHVTKITQLLHVENAEMVIRMCELFDWSFTAEDLSDEWLQITLVRN
jgi:hypothetical protein